MRDLRGDVEPGLVAAITRVAAVTDEVAEGLYAAIMEAVLRGSDRPLTIEELKVAVDWAHGAFTDCALITLVLDGEITIRLDEHGKLWFAAHR